MLYLPIFHINQLPDWIPFIGGRPFSFFNYIFNIADACVSVGVILILLFRRRFFKNSEEDSESKPFAVRE